jgi:BCD family chlorophyll transporter-like MFS transporter
MQDILLEPFGAQILGLSVSSTTGLTALLAGGMLVAFALSARRLSRGMDPHRLAAYGALVGVFAFATISLTGAFKIVPLFAFGVFLIGIGGGLFAVGTLTAAMALARDANSGLALGAWGAVQATATGLAMAGGGALRDIVSQFATNGSLGSALTGPAVGYAFVYNLEVVFLFVTLVVIGPLATFSRRNDEDDKNRFGLAEFPS